MDGVGGDTGTEERAVAGGAVDGRNFVYVLSGSGSVQGETRNKSRAINGMLIGALTFVLSFVVTNAVYIEWAVRTYPQANSMAGCSAFVLGLEVAPICTAVAVGLYLFLTRRGRAGVEIDDLAEK